MESTTPDASPTPDIPPPSSHRLPTISVAQALHDLESSGTRCISTGLKELDDVLQGREDEGEESEGVGIGGVSRGKVTEIWGPPGVGKTALGMQLAASALHAGEGVVWVDTSTPISGPRFSEILTSFKPITPDSSPPEPVNVPALTENLLHFSIPTIIHLFGILSYHLTNPESSNTSLIIIDSFPTLMSTEFPKTMAANSSPRKPGGSKTRRLTTLQNVINLLQKVAASRNLAIVMLSQCTTKMRAGEGTVLLPAIRTTAWEQGLGCRVVLTRDWGCDDEEGNTVTDVRVAEVVKADGTVVPEEKRRLVGFTIDNTGLRPLALPPSRHHGEMLPLEHASDPASPIAPAVPRKRRYSAAELEIPDSEGEDDEDYGWAEDDEEEMPPMPPQWQGSEDILVVREGEEESSEGEGDAEDGDGQESRDGEEIPSPNAGDTASGRWLGILEVGDSEEEEL